MEFENKLSATIAKPIMLLPCLLIIGLIGAFNALAHVHDAIWQDEAATLIFHVSRGIEGPFLYYASPNNHIAFSSMMAGWLKLFPEGIEVSTLRLLPFLLFLAAIPATFVAGYRLGGPICAVLASLMFASSTVAANFATQLRGYGPSWLFISLMFWCAMNVLNARRAWAWRIGYSLSSLALVAFLPTNFFLSSAMAVAVALYFWLAPENRNRRKVPGFLVLLLTPLLSLMIAYAAVWQELLRFSDIAFSPWTRGDLLNHWLHATISDFVWLSPLIGAGLLLGSHQVVRAASLLGAHVPKEFVLAVLLALGLAGALIVMPHAPFPRTMVPFLPVWLCAIAYIVTHGIRQLVKHRQFAWFALGAALFAAPIISGPSTQSCDSATGSGGAFDYDLCYQYFRDHYRPVEVVDIWASIGQQDLPIVTDFEGYFALQILNSKAKVFEYRNYQAPDHSLPLIVAHGQTELQRMTGTLGLSASSYKLIADTGYFKVFSPINGN